MTQEEYIKELKRLYELAIKVEDVSMAAELLERIRRRLWSSGDKDK